MGEVYPVVMTRPVDDLIRFLDRWQPRRIVVAGDFMVDRYVYGNADRLSPDAPVPVLAVERTESKPGGDSANLDARAPRTNASALLSQP
jgi:bifunctional ADP-heptose synthase (sugar kinase/adenylyltransferase)